MDKYWKMCEKAEKIQSSKREYGDCIVLKGEEYLVGYDNLSWLKNYGNGKPCKQWVYGYWVSDNPTFYGSKCIFLPTQDQLQKMINWKDYNISIEWFTLPYKFTWSQDPLEIDGVNGDSMEQLWLAFVMKEKFGKRWNDEKEAWESNKE